MSFRRIYLHRGKFLIQEGLIIVDLKDIELSTLSSRNNRIVIDYETKSKFDDLLTYSVASLLQILLYRE